MSSWHAKDRMTLGLCGLALGLLSACATGPADEAPTPQSRLGYPHESSTHPVVATKAFLTAADRLDITYLDGGREVSASIPVFAPTEPDPSHYREAPPIIPLQTSDPAATPQTTQDIPLVIRSIGEWHSLIQELEREIAAQVPEQGVVLDVLQQNDIFLYVDHSGSLQAVAIEDKPAAVEPAGTVTLTRLLQQATDRVRRSLVQQHGDHHYLLFNTGDSPDTGFPFVFMDLEHSRVFFIQRSSDDQLLAYGPAGSAHAALHAFNSQAMSLASRPLSTFARLVSSFGTTVLDTVHRIPTLVKPGSTPPPIRQAADMDRDAWERELDELVGSSTQGRIRYLVDGQEFFPALIHAINSARESVRIRMYLFDNDDYAVKIADLLKKRSKAVSVEILLDGLGTMNSRMARPNYTPAHTPPTPWSIANYLRADSNIQVWMLSNPFMQGDHTKTIIIDDDAAFIGGMNIGREYRYEWHDMMAELRGPVVDELIRDFENTRAHAGLLGDLQAAFQPSRHPVQEPGEDDYPLRLLYTRVGNSQILRSQIAAMRRAQNRVWIQNPYLTSDTVLHELVKARQRGVDVRVVLPYQTNWGLISRSNVLAANVMLRHGIRVYIYPGMSHLKAALYDGWACLGSANFDRLSLRLNKETNIATSHPEAFADLVDRVFLPDFERALELTEPLPTGWLDYLKEQIADHL